VALNNQRKVSPYVVSDDEDDSNSSVIILPNNNNNRGIQPTQDGLHIQELSKKSSEGGIRQKIDDITIEVDLQPKLPTQFRNMSNEFEIAYWLAHHNSILNLAVNIRNGLMNRTGTDEEH